MNHGKLFWNKLTVVSTEWFIGNYGHIDIHIPIQLYVPYDAMDDTPWIIRDAICSKLIQLGWPFEGKDCLYFFYYETYYHLQLHTRRKSTMGFYENLQKWKLTQAPTLGWGGTAPS